MHLGQHGLRHEVGAFHVCVHLAVPHVLGSFAENRQHIDARIVHQNVDAPEFGDYGRRHRRDIVEIADVTGKGHGLAAGLADAFDHSAGGGRIRAIDNSNACALAAITCRDGGADTA